MSSFFFAPCVLWEKLFDHFGRHNDFWNLKSKSKEEESSGVFICNCNSFQGLWCPPVVGPPILPSGWHFLILTMWKLCKRYTLQEAGGSDPCGGKRGSHFSPISTLLGLNSLINLMFWEERTWIQTTVINYILASDGIKMTTDLKFPCLWKLNLIFSVTHQGLICRGTDCKINWGSHLFWRI